MKSRKKYLATFAVLTLLILSIFMTSCATASNGENKKFGTDIQETKDVSAPSETLPQGTDAPSIKETNTPVRETIGKIESMPPSASCSDVSDTTTVDTEASETSEPEEPSETQAALTESAIPEEDDTEQTEQTSVGTNIYNDITIEGSKPELVYATASALRSVVSIYAKFGNYGTSTGSGVIYRLDADGSAYIITNFHVIYEHTYNKSVSDDISLFLYGREFDENGDVNWNYGVSAEYIGGSSVYDIAVLKVTGSEVLKSAMVRGSVAAATLADSNNIYPGQTAIAVGNPSGTATKGISATYGAINVDSESIVVSPANAPSQSVSVRVMRMDTPVNTGNSGGGLFNDKGELIGIVNAKSGDADLENIGFAIPINTARGIAQNIIDYCDGTDSVNPVRAIIGITVGVSGESYTEYDAQNGVLVKKEAVEVASVEAQKLAFGVLEVGDILKSVQVGADAKKLEISRYFQVSEAMLDARSGDVITFEIIRGTKELSVQLTITDACLTPSA